MTENPARTAFVAAIRTKGQKLFCGQDARNTLDSGLRRGFHTALDAIEERVREDSIDPFIDVVTLRSPIPPPAGHHTKANGTAARIGIFPLTANPITWGHVIRGLDCISRLRLDTVVFLVHGIIKHKFVSESENIPVAIRHKLACAVLQVFHPLLRYTDVALQTEKLGEETLHDVRRLNRDLEAEWVCIWGVDDRERLTFIPKQLATHYEENVNISSRHSLSLTLVVCDDEIGHLSHDECLAAVEQMRCSWKTAVLNASESCLGRTWVTSTDYRNTLDPVYVPSIVHDAVLRYGLYRTSGPVRNQAIELTQPE